MIQALKLKSLSNCRKILIFAGRFTAARFYVIPSLTNVILSLTYVILNLTYVIPSLTNVIPSLTRDLWKY